MKRKRAVYPSETPLSVLVGEFWEDAKLEIADSGRRVLEDKLIELKVFKGRERGEREVLWLRYRYAYALLERFYVERGLEVPKSVQARAKMFDGVRPSDGVPVGWVDIFRDARAQAKDKANMAAWLRGAQARQEAGASV